MDIATLFVSQRGLKRQEQLPARVEAILQGVLLEPIRLSEAEDGSVQIDDGHHRVVAYWLCGQTRLEPHQYILMLTDKPRVRLGRVPDLLRRVGLR
jgi:hypothetical protein